MLIELSNEQPKIKVAIRKRPLNMKETSNNESDIVEINNQNTVILKERKQKLDLTKYIVDYQYVFDAAFNETDTNQQIYKDLIKPLLEAAFNGEKVSCFAYGQTGSGKTYTMMGTSNCQEDNKDFVPGLYLLTAQDIFSAIQQKDVNIVGISEKKILNVYSLMQLISFGLSERIQGQTTHNLDSSRSHAILQIILKDKFGGNQGNISFIDLAGSERGSDVSDQNQQTKKDGAEINKSLLALKECIRALDQQKGYVPFRQSKLTLALRDSFLGKCRTVMIGNISPSESCTEDTLNTLRYADRIKELKKGNRDREGNDAMMLPRQQGYFDIKIFWKGKWKIVEEEERDNNNKVNDGQQNNQNFQKINWHMLPLLFQQSEPLQSTQNNNQLNVSPQIMQQEMIQQNYQHQHQEINLQSKNIIPLKEKENKSPNLNKSESLSEKEKKIINAVLDEEETLIELHRSHLQEEMEILKKEFELVQYVENENSDLPEYINKLLNLVLHKQNLIKEMINKIGTLNSQLNKLDSNNKDK